MSETSVYIFSSSDLSQKPQLPAGVFNKAQSGDQAAFGQVYNLFFPKIYRFIYFRVSHKETAEDLAEDVFLKAFGKIAGVKNPDSLEAWLYQIARNTIIDYYRDRKQTVNIDELENILEYESNIIDLVSLDQDQKLLLEILKQLTTEQQIVIKLKLLERLDNPTIAELLHKTETAIRVIQHRAIVKLQALLKDKLRKD